MLVRKIRTVISNQITDCYCIMLCAVQADIQSSVYLIINSKDIVAETNICQEVNMIALTQNALKLQEEVYLYFKVIYCLVLG